ncbi:sensor histidine kinase [Microbacterium sp.]|uniref:sensor histidine kinase n=1 Tax=Microbacterium sp. TaxID=51671 RepID=UPI0039E479B1
MCHRGAIRGSSEQQRFAANASHELRTPLAITRTLLEVARSDPDRDTAALLERLARVNDRSIELVEALLLLTRVERRAFERRDVDLSLLLEEAAEALLPLAEERGAELIVSSAPAPTSGSEPLLGQVAVNLLHNALVHGDPNRGPVSASTWLDEGEAVLVVESAGAVLDPVSVDTLVEPFQRGAARTRREGQEGAGLGLAIVAAIVRAHDGTLHLTARPSGGLRVVVRLAES